MEMEGGAADGGPAAVPSARIKPRRVWLAALLAVAATPLGHLYVGRPWRGLALFAALAVLGVGSGFLTLATGPLGFAAMIVLGAGSRVLFAVDAAQLARREGRAYALRGCNRWWSYVAATGLLLLSSVALRASLLQSFRIPMASMAPTLLPGDFVLTDKLTYHWRAPRRGELAVFVYPEDMQRLFVKRVVGLPGETVEIREKSVVINGKPLDEPYASFVDGRDGPMRSVRDNLAPLTLRPNQYFMLGDNRDRSYDSRFWGPLTGDLIVARAGAIYFSFDAEKSEVRWDRLGQRVE
jgi:signal peptidase I